MKSSKMSMTRDEKGQNTSKKYSREYGQSYFNRKPFSLVKVLKVLEKWKDEGTLDRQDRELGFPEGFATMSSAEQQTANFDLNVKKLKECLLECLGFRSDRTARVANSFGDFLRRHGGLAGILRKEIVELSEGVAMISMASAWASQNSIKINLAGQLDESHSKSIVRFIYENKYLFHKKDTRVGRLRNHCRRGKSENRRAFLNELNKKNWFFDEKHKCCDEKYKFLKKICVNHFENEDLSKGISLEINKGLKIVSSWDEAEMASKLEMANDNSDSSNSPDLTSSILLDSVNLPSTSSGLGEQIVQNRIPSPMLSGPKKRPSESTSNDDSQRKKLHMNVPLSNLDAESNKPKVSKAVSSDCSTDSQMNVITHRSTIPEPIIILDDDSRSSLVENAAPTVEPLENDGESVPFSNIHNCSTLPVKVEILEEDERESISSSISTVPFELDNVLNCNHFESISKFLENQKYSDVIFIIGEEKIHAHRVIISGVSDKFTELFDSTGDRPIVLLDIESVVFKELLRFIYTHEIRQTIDHKVLLKLREAVIKYLNDNLINQFIGPWENLINQILKIENAADILTFADRMEISHLKEVCMKFVKQNFEEVSVTEGYKELLNLRPELTTELIKRHLLKKQTK